MFVTEDLREKVDHILRTLDERAGWLMQVRDLPDDKWNERELLWAAERAMHVAVECSIDAANEIIDALVMREPGSYEDILRVLMEEGVVSRDWFEAYVGVLAFRDKLVRRYTSLSGGEVVEAVRTYAPLFQPYAAALRAYLGIA
jgi:uncharacterized protein YutE (UPF0331/DUF86 family)